MNIHIDLLHPAHVNLFKYLINTYAREFNFIVTCIDRGNLPKIAKEEIKSVPINIIGKHRGTKRSIIVEANLQRLFMLLWFLRGYSINIGLSFGSFLAGTVLRLRGVPVIYLSDDPERKLNAVLENLTCTARYLPPIVKETNKTKTFNALKEWSYLSPTYFMPALDVIEYYKLNPKSYVFIREVSTGSLNYLGQDRSIIASFAKDLPQNVKVVLSVEDKSTISHYPDHWIKLKEPVRDIHSIMYFSSLVLSSGDSMAREGAMLGVPSIYCGFREMKANQLLIDKGMLFKVTPNEVWSKANAIMNGNAEIFDQTLFREQLADEWIDVNEFLMRILEKSRNGN